MRGNQWLSGLNHTLRITSDSKPIPPDPSERKSLSDHLPNAVGFSGLSRLHTE